MAHNGINDNILSLLDNYTLDNSEDVAKEVAENFRRRRVEKNITRQHIAERSGVSISTVARFERTGLIAFESLIRLAMALGYIADIRNLFSTAKFNTMQELEQIRRKKDDKRAYPIKK